MLLGNDAEISLSVLDEIHLLVYLCSVVYPSAPKSELVSDLALEWNVSVLPTPAPGLWD